MSLFRLLSCGSTNFQAGQFALRFFVYDETCTRPARVFPWNFLGIRVGAASLHKT